MKLHWKAHPIAELFPVMTPDEKAALKQDMIQRADNGLDPLEHPILKYEDMILDGRHRDEAWMELAEEDACNGFFKRNLPPTESFSPDKYGNLVAFLRAKSRNMVLRQISASQQAAILLDAAEKYPEIKAALDAIKDENRKRQEEGAPLDAGDQRGNTAEQIGELAGAGATTVKEAQQLQKTAPEKFKEVLQGKKSTKKALKEAKEEQKTKEKKAKNASPKKAPEHAADFKPGDKCYGVYYHYAVFPPVVQIFCYEVEAVREKTYLATNGDRIDKLDALTLDAAKEKHAKIIEELLPELDEAVTTLKAALKKPPIENRAKKKA